MTSILAVDTSGRLSSVALWHLNTLEVVTATSEQTPFSQLLSLVEQVLARRSYPTVERIAYTQGPGSFTGIRLGLALAQGLAYAWQKPMVGVCTLQAIAQQCYATVAQSELTVAISAGMQEVYYNRYFWNANSNTMQPLDIVKLGKQDEVPKIDHLEAMAHSMILAGTVAQLALYSPERYPLGAGLEYTKNPQYHTLHRSTSR